jgi:hypothetical protein
MTITIVKHGSVLPRPGSGHVEISDFEVRLGGAPPEHPTLIEDIAYAFGVSPGVPVWLIDGTIIAFSQRIVRVSRGGWDYG